MSEFFANNATLIVFLHVLGAVVWIGGMIAIRVAVHPVVSRGGLTQAWMLQSDKVELMLKPAQRLGITLQIVGRLFNLVMPFIVILLVTALIMAVALKGHQGDQKDLFIAKEIIWSIMTLNYGYMYLKRKEAHRLFEKGDIAAAKQKVAPFANLLLPINIALGIIALFMGVVLRGL